MPYQKIRVKAKVPHLSGRNMSHRNSGTMFVGTLYPLLVEELIPGSRCSLKITDVVQLPPLVSDTYMNLKLKLEAFFVPMRLCARSFEDWFIDNGKDIAIYKTAAGTLSSGERIATKQNVAAAIPHFVFDNTVPSNIYGAGSLLDYLGFEVDNIQGNQNFCAMPVIAYHLIYNRYYRNARVQSEVFVPDLGLTVTQNNSSGGSQGGGYTYRWASFPDIYFHHGFVSGGVTFADNSSILVSSANYSTPLADGSGMFLLRQRNFGFDYFTGARPSPQQGQPMAVDIQLPAGATDTSFTIAQLRAANSLQQFRERNNLSSPRMVEQVYARYGARLADGVAQNPIFIGQATYDVVTRGVDQTAQDAGSGANPFNSVAAQYGRGFGVGSDFIIEDFTANEPGYVFVIQSLVPEVSYSSGVSPYLLRYYGKGSIVEMANPDLQNVGDEPIDTLTLTDTAQGGGSIFGYQDRFGTFGYHRNEIHGELRDGKSLDTFVLQRSFTGTPVIGSNFLQIPTTYLDDVMVVSSGTIGCSAWYDAKLDWKVSMPLADFSLPSLQNPAYEHGKDISIIRNGQIF